MLLTLLALAAPLPAFAISDQALKPVTANPSPAALSVSASLDSCGVLGDQVVCKLDVAYNAIPDATSYTATVTRADGSVVDYGGVAAGGTSLWVPYVGSGRYSVRVTAYGEPQKPAKANGHKHVIETDVAAARAKPEKADKKVRVRSGPREQASAGPRDQATAEARGAAPDQTAVDGAAVEATPSCARTVPPALDQQPLPEKPPDDLDPNNPDEDADGIPDEQEQIAYEAAVAQRQAAEAIAQVPESVDC